MQINTVKNFKNNQPNFGMAKLTAKGRKLVQQTYGTIPYFADKNFSKKNSLSRLLKSNVLTGDIERFFDGGLSDYALVNKKFYQTQLSTLSGRYQIKKFLKANIDTQAGSGGLVKTLNKIGNELKEQIIVFFDKNVNNELISARQGKKLLSLIEPYMQVDEFAKRNAILSDRVFFRK